METAVKPSNGKPVRLMSDILADATPLTAGYKPTLPLWAEWCADITPQLYLLKDIEMMLVHPIVLNALNNFKAAIGGAEFWGGPSPDKNPDGLPYCESNPAVNKFVGEQVNRYWDCGMPLIQNGYEYGWIGAENMYCDDEGALRWDSLLHFSPRDCFLLTQGSEPVGVRIKNVVKPAGGPEPTPAKGTVDLWTAWNDIPAKGLWYNHNPRYNQYYGQSQLLGAWRPWRRLAWKDGGESNLDGGFYRGAYSGVQVDYPEEDYQAQPGTPATTLDSQGYTRKYARDIARQIAEQAKSGASFGLPSTNYPSELGGGPKWKVTWITDKFNGTSLLKYIEYLETHIRLGIGIPPELLEAAETGSGYSGRQIPLDGFMMLQQRLADAMLKLFVDQVLQPLVLLNFGDVRFTAKVKSLLATKRAQAKGAEGSQQQRQMMPGMGQQRPEGPPPAPAGMTRGAPFSMNLVTERIRRIARRSLARAE